MMEVGTQHHEVIQVVRNDIDHVRQRHVEQHHIIEHVHRMHQVYEVVHHIHQHVEMEAGIQKRHINIEVVEHIIVVQHNDDVRQQPIIEHVQHIVHE